MGYEMHFDDGTEESQEYVFTFGSAEALEMIREWAQGLPQQSCPRLHELLGTLTTSNTMELGAELEEAMDVDPPAAQIRPILKNLVARIGVGDEDESLTIGEGFPLTRADRQAVESAFRRRHDDES